MKLLLVLLTVACTRSGASSSSDFISAPSLERDVQTAVLDSFLVQPGVARLVVVDSTLRGADHFVDEDYAAALRMLGDLPAGLREDLEQKRRPPMAIQELRTRVPVVAFSEADRAALRSAVSPTEGWLKFRARFPASSGRIAISRVGFSRDGRFALMLMDYGCGDRCGGTVYYLLARQENAWKTIRTAQPRMV